MRSLVPWTRKPGGPFEAFRQEMDEFTRRFFNDPLFGEGAALTTPATLWMPRVDVQETDKEVIVKADLPGVDPKDLDVSVVEGSLILRGEKKEEHKEEAKGYRHVERFLGQFYRELPLPAGVDPEKVTAACAKGVVTVNIPKKPAAQVKKIAVKMQE